MISVPVPQDVFKRESKVVGDFSARQILSITVGGIIGVAAYFGLFSGLSNGMRVVFSVLLMFPVLAFGFVKIYDQPVEKILPVIIQDNLMTPAVRYFKTENIIEEEDIKKLRIDTYMDAHGGRKPPKKKKKVIPSKTLKAIR